MPNHVHLLWEMIEMNGKELPHASFRKYTAHALLSDLKLNHPNVLVHFKIEERERFYRFWQRDPLAVLIQGCELAEQKLNYMRLNPLQSHWSLCPRP